MSYIQQYSDVVLSLTHHLLVTSSWKFAVQIGDAETNRNPAVEWGQSQDKAEFVRNMLYAMFLVQSSCISSRHSCCVSTFFRSMILRMLALRAFILMTIMAKANLWILGLSLHVSRTPSRDQDGTDLYPSSKLSYTNVSLGPSLGSRLYTSLMRRQ